MTEKIDKREVTKDTEIKTAFEDTSFSIYIVLLLDFIRNNGILVSMQFFNFILTNTETAVYTIFIGLIREDIVTELKADVVESFKGIYFANNWVLWLFVLCITLEENEDTTILLLEALSEKDFIDIYIFLLLAYYLEPYTLRVQIISICFKASIPIGKV